VTQVVATVAEPPTSEPSTADMALITALSIEETDSWAHMNGSITKGRGQAGSEPNRHRLATLDLRRYSLLRANERARLSDVQNDAAVYFAFSQSTENFIDGIEGELLDSRLDFAFGGKAERFLKIFSCAHDRPSESVAT